MIVVVSTGYNAPTRDLCEKSLWGQTAYPGGHRHVYIEASEQTPPKPASQNLYEAIAKLDPDDIVVWLDGDDWLAHKGVIARVEEMHHLGAWLTYGQYVDQDGKPGHCRLHDHEDYRAHPFVASHLKTFRAGLFQKLAPEDLQLDGEWVSLGVDVAVMLPLLELAGPKRTRFCPEVLCVYHRPTSWEASASPAALAREQEVVARLRAKPRKERLECL